ncbi:hypothetical protein RYX36_016211 [Vicia faba]
MSPFLICGAIFLRIFWSSEKTQLRYVKIEEKKDEQEIKVEPKILPPKIPIPIPNIVGRHEQILFKYPSQNATSRRRNFRERKWDVYGGLEEKAKNLSEVFQNEYTSSNRNIGSFKKGESSLYYGLSSGRRTHQAVKRSLRSEPSMVDLVEAGDTEMEIEKMEEEDEEEDVKNNTIEWTENDQKNLMDVGDSEMERNRRLESLIARRRANKLLKLQVENGLVDKKALTPSSMRPLVVKRESCDIDDLEMPGSAPSVMPRSPYDIPYEPFEEKPNLTSDGFLNDFQKDVLFSRHESFSLGSNYSSDIKHEHATRESHSFHGRKSSDKHGFSRFGRLPDKGNHDWLIEQLIYNDGAEKGIQAPKPLIKGDETKRENDEKCKTDIDETKTMSVQTSESASRAPNISNIETNSVSQKPESRLASRLSKSQERLLNIPVSFNETKTIHESMCDTVPSPVDKRQETMFSGDRRLCHTPTYSIASDLQVEVSEVGSPTSTVDDNGDTNSSSDRDRDSMLYDGDIDRDVSSGSEDLWGASFHGKGGVKTEENNSNEGPEDTPTCCVVNSDHNVFGNYTKFSRGKNDVPQSSRSSYDTLSQNQLISSPMDQISEEISINESHVIDDVNNLATTEQGDRENSASSEDPGNSHPVVRQESLDEASNESISSSPRSVLPDKTLSDDVSSPSFNQQMDIGSPRSIVEDMTQETLNEDEHSHDSMAQNFQTLVDEITNESHDVDFNHSQGEEINMESSMEESNIHRSMNDEEINRMEQRDELNNGESSEENSSHQISQEATSESTKEINKMETMDEEESRDLTDDKVPSTEVVEEDKNEPLALANDDNINDEFPQPHVIDPMVHGKETIEGHMEDS